MIAELLAAFTLFLAPYVTVHATADVHPVFPTATAWRTCVNGRADIYFRTGASLEAKAWEWAGALDCNDDGRMDGSTVLGCDVADFLARNWWAREYQTARLAYDARYLPPDRAGALLASECASEWIIKHGWRPPENGATDE